MSQLAKEGNCLMNLTEKAKTYAIKVTNEKMW